MEDNMNEVSQQVKKILVVAVLAMVFIIATASLWIFAVNARNISAHPVDDKNAAQVEAIYKAEKAKLDYLLQPLDRISSLLQLLAATVITYIFAKETGPALAKVASAFLARRDP
jgi:hypothetical protein